MQESPRTQKPNLPSAQKWPSVAIAYTNVVLHMKYNLEALRTWSTKSTMHAMITKQRARYERLDTKHTQSSPPTMKRGRWLRIWKFKKSKKYQKAENKMETKNEGVLSLSLTFKILSSNATTRSKHIANINAGKMQAVTAMVMVGMVAAMVGMVQEVVGCQTRIQQLGGQSNKQMVKATRKSMCLGGSIGKWSKLRCSCVFVWHCRWVTCVLEIWKPSIRLVWMYLGPPCFVYGEEFGIGDSWRLSVKVWHSLSSFVGVMRKCWFWHPMRKMS